MNQIEIEMVEPGSQVGKPVVAARQPAELLRINTSGARLADGVGRWLAPALGILGGVALSYMLQVANPPGSIIGRMFDLRRWETIIPVAIFCVFCWGLLASMFRWLQVRALRRMSSIEYIEQIERTLREQGLESASASLEHPSILVSPLLRRIKAVLQQWGATPSLQDADIVLQQHIAHDEEKVHQNYTLIRLFVWALPVLGLIGTVIGISLAVGGFADFLGGGIDDVSEIKKNLVSVTAGLSFAFLITLEGLATSLILMFITSALQTAEVGIYGRAQKAITNMFLPLLQRVAGVKSGATGNQLDTVSTEIWRQSLEQSAQTVLKVIESTAERILGGISSQQETQRARMDEWAGKYSATLDKSTSLLIEGIDMVTDTAGKTFNQLTASTSQLVDRMDKHDKVLAAVLNQHQTLMAQILRELARLVSEQSRTLEENASTLREVATTTERAKESNEVLVRNFRELNDNNGNWLLSLSALAEVMNKQNGRSEQMLQAYESLIKATNELAVLQKALHEATHQLHETGLSATLASVRDTLSSVVPVLENFRRPFVLQAMPVSLDGQNS
jgi:biopolymer transport protein ExbB/TolQ